MTKREAVKFDLTEKRMADIEGLLDELDITHDDFCDAQDRILHGSQELKEMGSKDIFQVAKNPSQLNYTLDGEYDVDAMNDAAIDFTDSIDEAVDAFKKYRKLDPKGFIKFRLKQMSGRHKYLFDTYIDKRLKK
jgi:hypothetical protein